jgi:transposase
MQVYLGIDWSEKKHDVVFQNEKGAQLLYLCIAHTLAGFTQLDQAREQLGFTAADCVVGMETAHNLLIDYLWSRGYEHIYVLPPNQVKSSQGRHRQSGARDDPQDADLIAEIVRTDRQRLYPWHPGSPLLQQMRAKLGSIRFQTQEIVRLTNRLRAVLLRYYPAAVQVFSSLDTQIALVLIQTYPTPQAAAQLDFEGFKVFARQQGYHPTKNLAACFARLHKPYPPASEATIQAYTDEAVFLASLLLPLVQGKSSHLRELQKLYEQHPDRFIFDSLPAAGTLLSAGLLVKLGEDHDRFPSASVVQALAGTCPVTQKSGKSRFVSFRRACDQEFRYLVQEWARGTVNVSVWATGYYQQVRPHCRSEHHAYRCLANRWIEILWKLWHDRIAYDETYHLKRRAERLLPRRSA